MASYSKAQLKAAALAQRHALADDVLGVEWQREALCAQTDPEAFYPHDEKWSGAAKQVCARCPVVAQCLAYALSTAEPHGVWGGLTTVERELVAAVLASPAAESAAVERAA